MKLAIIAASISAIALTGCARQGSSNLSAERKTAIQQEQVAQRAQDEVGIYTPTHFTRKRLANMIGQMMDDPSLATVSYAQGLDGRLRCIGHSIGYPMPGGTQTTSPQKWDRRPGSYLGTGGVAEYEQVPQSEPDQLYYPESAAGTYVVLVNKSGGAKPIYFEGNVAAFPRDTPPDASLIAQPCSE